MVAPGLFEDVRAVTEAAASARIRELVAAAAGGGGADPRSLLLIGPPDGAAPLRAVARSAAELHGGRIVPADCAACGADSLGAVRSLLGHLLPVVHREAPGLLESLAPELAAVDPALANRFGLHPRRPLGQLASTPSERRSHRESEFLFRIVNGMAMLVANAAQQCPSLGGGPLVLWWSHLHAADQASLLAFRRISRWASQRPDRLLVIAAMDPRDGPRVAGPDLTGLRPQLAALLDWGGAQAGTLRAVRAQSMAQELTIDGATEDTPAGPPSGPTPVADAIAEFSSGAVERACALALRAMGPAAFTLNYAATLLLAGHVLAAVRRAGEHFDTGAFDAAWRATAPVEHYAAIEFSVTRPTGRDDLLASAWKAAGFANACLDRHEAALACYRQALELAATPARRAQARMYLGLITGKRLRDVPGAEEHIRIGLSEVDGSTDPDCVLERGWLLNVAALMAFQTRRFRDAMSMVTQARRIMHPLHTSEATHLKVNLVSNISVLLEEGGRLDRSIEVWKFFTAFLGVANELFAKHYYFREAGLLLKAGRPAEALESMRASFDSCLVITDPFHAGIVAEGCGFLCYRLGDLAGARGWYERAVGLARQAGDHERIPTLVAAVALVDGADRDDPAAAERANLHAPLTKLNRPFSLVNAHPPERSS